MPLAAFFLVRIARAAHVVLLLIRRRELARELPREDIGQVFRSERWIWLQLLAMVAVFAWPASLFLAEPAGLGLRLLSSAMVILGLSAPLLRRWRQ